MTVIWKGLGPVQPTHGYPGKPDSPCGPDSLGPVSVGIARIYDEPAPGQIRVLVDRLWPRGLSKAGPPFDEWVKDIAPSAELRMWYGHRPDRFTTFARRYRKELEKGPAFEALSALRVKAKSSPVLLLTASKDLERSGAAVLRDVLAGP